MNGKNAKKIRKLVERQNYSAFELCFKMLNAQSFFSRLKLAFRLIRGKL